MQRDENDIKNEYKRVNDAFENLNALYSLNKKEEPLNEEDISEEKSEIEVFSTDTNEPETEKKEILSYRTVVKYKPVSGKSVVIVILVLVVMASAIFCSLVLPDILYKADYYSAMAFYSEKNYPRAAQLFEELGGYKDSAEMLYKTKYEYGIAFFQSGKYLDASKVFSEIVNYQNSSELRSESIYRHAGELYSNGEFDEAIKLYEGIIEYKDVEAILNDTVYEEAFGLFIAGDYEKSIELFGALKENEDARQFVTICKAYLMDKERNAEWSSISSVMAALGAMDNDSARLALKLNIFKGEKLAGSWVSADGMYKISLDRPKGKLDVVLPMDEAENAEFKIDYGIIYRRFSGGKWEECIKIESFTPDDVSQPESVVLYNFFDGQEYTLLKE